MKRVLVTGASGFIGRDTVPALFERGYEVHTLGRSTEFVEGITAHAGDLMDSRQTSATLAKVRPSHLLHLAWYAEHGKFWNSTENYRWVGASLSLLDAFHRAGGRRAVLAGSGAEYDWSDGRCDEALTPLAPATVYGTCKNATRLLFDAWRGSTGISGAWGRVFHLYGPRESPERLVASVIRALLRDEDAPCTHGRQRRDLLHVSDVAGAFAALLDSPVEGSVNIGAGVETSLAEVAQRIADLIGRPARLKLGARPADPDDPPRLVPVTDRLMKEVGWRPRYDLDQGLRQTIDWWRSQVHPGKADS